MLSRDLRERGEQTIKNYGLDNNHHEMMKSSDGMRFTLGKDALEHPATQPLRSDGFHYTH